MGTGHWKGLWRACHPEPTVAVTALTAAFAVSAGRGWGGTLWVAAAVLAGQLSVGWHNDYVDRHRDSAARRRDKPVATGDVAPGTVRRSAAIALGAAAVLSFGSGWRAALVHLLGLGAAWGYNAGLKATGVSVLPYVVAFGGAPAFVVLGLPGHPLPPAWMMAATALLGAGAHFVNVLPDMDEDIRVGVRGLPHRLGPRRSAVLAAVLLGGASVILAVVPRGEVDLLGLGALIVVGTLLAGAVTAGQSPGSRWAFRFVLLVAAVDVVLLVARGATLADPAGLG